MKNRILLLCLLCLVPLFASAQPVPKTLKLTNGKGVVYNSIKGYTTHDYSVMLTKGQKIMVKLTNRDRRVFFNFMPKGTETAIFVGSTSGNTYRGVAPKDGTYIVRVYQMRVTARRAGVHKYQLNVVRG